MIMHPDKCAIYKPFESVSFIGYQFKGNSINFDKEKLWASALRPEYPNKDPKVSAMRLR
jgi:hypothetical protein